MRIIYCRRGFERVVAPMHPDRIARKPILIPDRGAGPIVYRDKTGTRHEVKADEHGFFEVPDDVALRFVGDSNARKPRATSPEGHAWYRESEVDEEVRLGRVAEHGELTTPPALGTVTLTQEALDELISRAASAPARGKKASTEAVTPAVTGG